MVKPHRSGSPVLVKQKNPLIRRSSQGLTINRKVFFEYLLASLHPFDVPCILPWPNLIGGPENTDAAWFHSLVPELLNSIIKIKATFFFCSPMAFSLSTSLNQLGLLPQ